MLIGDSAADLRIACINWPQPPPILSPRLGPFLGRHNQTETLPEKLLVRSDRLQHAGSPIRLNRIPGAQRWRARALAPIDRSQKARKPKPHQRTSLSQGAGIPPYSGPTNGTMRAIVVVFILALLTIAFEIYSEAELMSGGASHAGPDPVTLAIAHGLKGG